MAHSRKDNFCCPVQWWKHLKHFKRLQNKKERIAAKRRIRNDEKLMQD